jgi:type VI secretion system protein VasD
MPRFSIVLTLGLLAAGLFGCKPRGETCDPDDHVYEHVVVQLRAATELNLDDDGNPLPTVVRIYQLTGDLAIRGLEFDELWRDHQAALGDEYLAHVEIQIYPNSNEAIEITVDPKARHLLAFAGFQQPVGTSWYRIYRLPDSYGQQACALRAADQDPAKLGQPCMHLSLDRNHIDGGATAPSGFDPAAFTNTCTPPDSAAP